MNSFLTRPELYTLTGYWKPSLVIKRLQQRGIPHEVNRFGQAAVSRDWRKTVVTEPEMGHVR